MPDTPRDNHAFLTQIGDRATRDALQVLLNRVGNVERLTNNIGTVSQPLGTDLDSGGNRLKAVADPEHDQDAVNLQTLRKYVDAQLHPVPVRTYIPPVLPPVPDVPPPAPAPPPPAPPAADYQVPQNGVGTVKCGGRVFHLDDGSIWPWRGCTDFLLYKRYLDNEDLTPILANRVAAGANLVRVLGMAFNIANFNPLTYPTYFRSLGPFANLLAANGLYLEFVTFADCQFIPDFTGSNAQLEHFSRVVTAFGNQPNVFLELVNEYSKNGVNPGAGFLYPPGILSSKGSGQTDENPYTPPWDYSTFHVSRSSEWPRKSQALKDLRDGFAGFTKLNRPVVADEGMGAADVDVPGNRSTNVQDFYWYAATAQMMGAGATFHSDNGIQSQVYSAVQQACANNFFAGLAAVPPETQLWTYTRGPFADCPLLHDDTWALRTYAKYTDHDAYAIVIRPTGVWPGPLTQGGWAVVNQVGPIGPGATGGTLIQLSR